MTRGQMTLKPPVSVRNVGDHPTSRARKAAARLRRAGSACPTVEVLNSPMCPEGWKILAEIVAPSEALRVASERRAPAVPA
jgi:hypothetical protein